MCLKIHDLSRIRLIQYESLMFQSNYVLIAYVYALVHVNSLLSLLNELIGLGWIKLMRIVHFLSQNSHLL
jgi:hypothetical protein